MDKKLHRLETFRVQDLHGATYKVHAYEHLTRVDNLLDMQTQWEPTGEFEYKLATGEHLEVDEDGTMYVAGSGMPLQRVSPSAHAM
ncbi:MAG: hypothetical protein HYX44_02240 [Aquabacterium sp.]|nr:hypothetical protein [Aquabacterium sp.]